MRKETDLILEARDAGMLPASIRVEIGRTNLMVRMPDTRPIDFEANARAAALFAVMFGEGETKSGYYIFRGDRRRPAADRAEYRAKTDAGLIQLWYAVPHTHDHYRGEVVNGKPRWACTGCRKRITITEARALGLLPAKP